MNEFDLVVADMMREFGTTALIKVQGPAVYDYNTSKSVPSIVTHEVKAMFFDYIDKKDGLGTNKNTLIQSGDKQVFVQPPHKAGKELLPMIQPNKCTLELNGKSYKVVTAKQYNPSMIAENCILFELYIRE